MSRGGGVGMSKTLILVLAFIVCSNILSAQSASAQQTSGGSTFQDQTQVDPHHQRIYQMMKDMTQEMSSMTEQMSQGALTSDQQKQMAKRIHVDNDGPSVGSRGEAGNQARRHGQTAGSDAKADGRYDEQFKNDAGCKVGFNFR